MDTTELRRIGIRARLDEKIIEELTFEDFNDLLTFTDRDSYLEWRAEWKKDYKTLSEEIRFTKKACKGMQKAGSEKAPEMQAILSRKGFDARMMLALRRASKAYSWHLKGMRVQLDEGVFV